MKREKWKDGLFTHRPLESLVSGPALGCPAGPSHAGNQPFPPGPRCNFFREFAVAQSSRPVLPAKSGSVPAVRQPTKRPKKMVS